MIATNEDRGLVHRLVSTGRQWLTGQSLLLVLWGALAGLTAALNFVNDVGGTVAGLAKSVWYVPGVIIVFVGGLLLASLRAHLKNREHEQKLSALLSAFELRQAEALRACDERCAAIQASITQSANAFAGNLVYLDRYYAFKSRNAQQKSAYRELLTFAQGGQGRDQSPRHEWDRSLRDLIDGVERTLDDLADFLPYVHMEVNDIRARPPLIQVDAYRAPHDDKILAGVLAQYRFFCLWYVNASNVADRAEERFREKCDQMRLQVMRLGNAALGNLG